MKILLPIDGSAHSDAVIQELIHRPWPQDTEVRLISVAHPFPEIPDPLLVGRALHIDSLKLTRSSRNRRGLTAMLMKQPRRLHTAHLP